MSSTGHTTRSAGPAGNEPERPSQGPLAERELRLALVLNGGVSLAVWMGGVTQEIDILRRVGFASGAGATDPQPTDEFWLALLSGLGIRVVVDVIAGTSAGGLNGAILGTAIARGCSVPDLRKTWIELGDFDSKLLDRDAQSVAKSVLRGKYFLCELIRLFQDRLRAPQQPAAEAEIDVCEKDDQATPSLGKDRLRAGRQRLKCALRRESHLPRAMLLFLTGTALRGTSKTHQDEIRNRFAYPDHRLRFTFRRNVAGDVDQFADDDGYEASRRLARAGRATASFPAAFEPAFVNASGSFEGLLSCEPDGAVLDTPEGPEMQPITDVAASRWVIDGGVLDNEPFEPILDEIRLRPLAGDVERALIYVVPALADPEEPAPSDDASKPPGVMASVLAAFNLPRDLDVLGDLERLRQLQLESDVDRATRRRLAIRAMEGRLTSAANELYQH